jgi:hypothetical protein
MLLHIGLFNQNSVSIFQLPHECYKTVNLIFLDLITLEAQKNINLFIIHFFASTTVHNVSANEFYISSYMASQLK